MWKSCAGFFKPACKSYNRRKISCPGNLQALHILSLQKNGYCVVHLTVNETGIGNIAKFLPENLQLVLSHGHPDHAYYLNEV